MVKFNYCIDVKWLVNQYPKEFRYVFLKGVHSYSVFLFLKFLLVKITKLPRSVLLGVVGRNSPV